MRQKKIELEYLTYPDGRDFDKMDEFVNSVDHNYFLSINKKRTDALGGGLYEFIVKITEDISLLELAKSYVEDGIKILIGFSLKAIFTNVKELFHKNEKLRPAIQEITLDFKDCKIKIYEIYENGIEESFDEIMEQLFIFRLEKKELFKNIKMIHIPILHHRDSYDLCDYRVKLNVDETVDQFTKQDYLNFWGITTKEKGIIYNVSDKRIINEKFYTQKAYDKLFDNACKNGELN